MSFLKDVSAPLGDAAGPPCTACQQSWYATFFCFVFRSASNATDSDANRGVQWSGQPYHRNCLGKPPFRSST